MSATPEFKGRAARPAEDNDDAYSGSSYMAEEYTLPGGSMDDDARSVASVSSYESYDSYCPRERLPSYRVAKDRCASQPVYEAWVLCMSHEDDHDVTRLTACGLDILSAHDEERPFVVSRTEAYEQEELSDMTLASVNSYHAASRRGFAARIVRGKPKTYEQDLDERLRKLPVTLQSNLNGLLRNREESTSNRFRRRDWTVVMMREQYRYRFTSAAPEPVKKKGFWKARDSRRVEYLFIIRGAEGRVAADEKGMYQPREFGNPWKIVDEQERRLRERSKDIRRFGKEYVQDGWFPRPRGRSLSPMPNPPGPVPPVRKYPRPSREVAPLRERGRPCSRSRSRSRSRSPYYPPMRDEYPPPPLPPPRFNPFVPLPVHMPVGGMPPLPPPPGPMVPPYVPRGNHLPPFSLPPFEPYMQPRPFHGPPPPDNLVPEPCTWPRPMRIPRAYAVGEATAQSGQVPIPMLGQHAAPFPLEMSSPPLSPLPSFHCMGGATPAPLAPLTMEACHALFSTESPRGDSDSEDGDGVPELSWSSSPGPPPAPKPSNLTTPTHFSPATSQHTGLAAQSSGVPPAPGAPGMDVFWG